MILAHDQTLRTDSVSHIETEIVDAATVPCTISTLISDIWSKVKMKCKKYRKILQVRKSNEI